MNLVILLLEMNPIFTLYRLIFILKTQKVHTWQTMLPFVFLTKRGPTLHILRIIILTLIKLRVFRLVLYSKINLSAFFLSSFSIVTKLFLNNK